MSKITKVAHLASIVILDGIITIVEQVLETVGNFKNHSNRHLYSR